MSHKRFLVELSSEERTYLKQAGGLRLAQDAAPAPGPDLAALRPGARGTGLDRRTHSGSRGRDRHDRVPGAPGPGPGGDGNSPATQAASRNLRDRNALGEPVNWQFTTADARIKLLHLYTLHWIEVDPLGMGP